MKEINSKMKKALEIERYSEYFIIFFLFFFLTPIAFMYPNRFVVNLLLFYCISSLIFIIIFRVYIKYLKYFLFKKYSPKSAWLGVDPNRIESHNIQSIEHTLFPDLDPNTRERIDQFIGNQFIGKMEKTEVIPKLTFVINKFLSLKLENNTTQIYIKNQLFKQCKFLLMNIDPDEIEKYDKIDSIDDLDSYLDRSLEDEKPYDHGITPEQEFHGHCSNLQVWYEYDYDTRILHSNLAFPLLKKLTEVGDPKAKIRFKEEIVKRYLEGNNSVRGFLYQENYLDFLTIDEIVFLVREVLEKEGKIKLKVNLVRKKDTFRLVSLANGEDVSVRDESETLTGRLEVPHDDNDFWKLGKYSELDSLEFFEIESEKEKEKEEGSE